MKQKEQDQINTEPIQEPIILITAEGAVKKTEEHLEVGESIVDKAAEKYASEICKYIDTCCKAGKRNLYLEKAGLDSLPQYVEPRAGMLNLSDDIQEAGQKKVLELGYLIRPYERKAGRGSQEMVVIYW